MNPASLRAVEVLSSLFVVAAFSVVVRTRIEAHIRIYSAQAVVLSLLGVVAALDTGRGEIWIGAVLTMGVKALLVPWLLARLVARLGVRREVESFVTIPASLLLAGGLAGVSWAVAVRAAASGAVGAPMPLAASLVGVFVGLLVMTTRRKALTQVFGLLLFENGLQFAAFSTTRGMPMIVEVGVAFDLLVAVIALGVLTLRMRESFGDVDVARLRELRG